MVSDASGYLVENQLQRVGPIECINSGYQLTYECSTVGAGVTHWIINSTEDRCQIILLHSQIRNGEINTKTCRMNETVVVSQNVSFVENYQSRSDQVSEKTYFFTRINITAHNFLVNLTVQCNLIDNTSVTTVAGIDTISSKAGDIY